MHVIWMEVLPTSCAFHSAHDYSGRCGFREDAILLAVYEAIAW